MIDTLLILADQFVHRKEPDIIFSQGEFIPNPFKKFSKSVFKELCKKAEEMNVGR